MSNLGRVPRAILLAFILASWSNSSFPATITAEARTVRIEGQITPGGAERLATLVLSLKREDACAFNCLRVNVDSEGGSVSESLKIGRFWRSHNASVFLGGEQCLSSCVFILMAGDMRDAILGGSIVGVHRPFLFDADQDKDFEQAYRETRSELEAYFDEMRVPRSLLDLMYRVVPDEMRILSQNEIELFLPSMDPVHEEQRVISFADAHGISNFEYRSRDKKADEECELDLDADDPIGTWENCRQAISWGLTLEEFVVRKALSTKSV